MKVIKGFKVLVNNASVVYLWNPFFIHICSPHLHGRHVTWVFNSPPTLTNVLNLSATVNKHICCMLSEPRNSTE